MVACSSQRPTLPPLHSLGLPNPSARMSDAPHELSYDNPSCPRLHIPQWRHARRVSGSSSMTSRSPSPPLFDSASSSRASSPSTEPEDSLPTTPVLSISPLSSRMPHPTSPHNNATPLRFRLEPCTLDDAQAIVLIPPPCAPFIPSTSVPTPQQKQQALLLLGPSMEYFRHPQRQLAKGARIHPYRITPSRRKDGVWSRRSSGSLTP